MNDGIPKLLTKDADFTCNCKPRFYGPFCEYDSLSKKVSNNKLSYS